SPRPPAHRRLRPTRESRRPPGRPESAVFPRRHRRHRPPAPYPRPSDLPAPSPHLGAGTTRLGRPRSGICPGKCPTLAAASRLPPLLRKRLPVVHLVTAIIKPFKLEEAKEALRGAGVLGLTVSEVQGFGRQGGKSETFRGSEYAVAFVPKVKVEVLCNDTDADKLVELIAASARTGKIGDGKIWSAPVGNVIRV